MSVVSVIGFSKALSKPRLLQLNAVQIVSILQSILPIEHSEPHHKVLRVLLYFFHFVKEQTSVLRRQSLIMTRVITSG